MRTVKAIVWKGQINASVQQELDLTVWNSMLLKQNWEYPKKSWPFQSESMYTFAVNRGIGGILSHALAIFFAAERLS